MDLEFGRIKVKAGGSAGGHNGIKSIDKALSTPKYARVRMGVGHAQRGAHAHDNTVNWVLGGFGPGPTQAAPRIPRRRCRRGRNHHLRRSRRHPGEVQWPLSRDARGKASAATATRVQNALIDGSLCGILERLDEDPAFHRLVSGGMSIADGKDIAPIITVGTPDGLRPAIAAAQAEHTPSSWPWPPAARPRTP